MTGRDSDSDCTDDRHAHVTIENRSTLERTPAHELALECVTAGLEAAHPERVLDERLAVEDDVLSIRDVDGGTTRYELASYDDVVVVGGGNAAGHLARALETHLGDRLSGGAVVTDDPAPTDLIEVLPGDHPFPSERGRESTRRVLELADGAGEDDLVLACITGGGSALVVAPAGSLSVDDLRTVTDDLLRSGASIDEINAVRKHCSAVKGGGLADVASPATVVGLVLSDVVGDDLGVVSSGPISPDPTTYADALAVLERYGIDGPDAVLEHLRRGDRGEFPETPVTGAATFDGVTSHLLASATTAIDAAAGIATDCGYDPLVLSSGIRGESSEVARVHVAIAEECLATGNPVTPPAVLLSGGETTVSVTGDGGTGGPNQEFVLSAALELTDEEIVVASVDSDGIDGPTDVAGAIVDSSSLAASGLEFGEARTALAENDAQPALEAMGTLVRTGPTGTNVNDLRVVVVDGEGGGDGSDSRS
ncbi:DUF4147 domain-containing protein [Halobacteria archaeon AArc-m2/3/4]|uniref:DUF4147 domain-containing protein n=1 Tax=Natronoglomus mannanivorans TaxID=2979990 RepID=A0ABT2QK78_9EURY|nr:DUF4147 domain-containing protein [Halobacteria archaeon AArc-m2/3/4]